MEEVSASQSFLYHSCCTYSMVSKFSDTCDNLLYSIKDLGRRVNLGWGQDAQSEVIGGVFVQRGWVQFDSVSQRDWD